MNCFKVVAPHQFLCTVSSAPEFTGNNATLTTADQMIYAALKASTEIIGECVHDFNLKQEKGALRIAEEGMEAEGET